MKQTRLPSSLALNCTHSLPSDTSSLCSTRPTCAVSREPCNHPIRQRHLSVLHTKTAAMSSWANTYFGDQLVTKSGLQSTSEVLKGKKYVGIYFRSFTPVLSEFYEQLKEEDENSLEVIFASSDSDANSFNSYYGEMPWNAIPFEHPSIKEALSTRFAVRGIPTFIILNMADGSVKDSDGRSTVAAAKGNISKVLGKWA